MKKLTLALVLALALCLISAVAFAAEPLLSLGFDGEEEIVLMGGAVVEDGVLKLPGGASHEGGYVVLPNRAIQEVTDAFTWSGWVYIPADATYNTFLYSFANGNTWPGMFACVTPDGNMAMNIDYRGNWCTEAVVPTGAWTYLTLTLNTTDIVLYVGGEAAASYNTVTKEAINSYWCITNGGAADTTFFGNLNKVDSFEGLIGTCTWVNGYDQRGDATAMYDDWTIYAAALTADEAVALYAAETVPTAAWPIGAAPVENPVDAKAKEVNVPENGLRMKLTFDSAEDTTLVGNAAVADGKLQLPGGAWREGGHVVLPTDAILMCGNEMTLSMFVNIAENPAGRSFLYAFSNGDSWPGIYAFVDVDGLVHFNVDYRGEMVPATPVKFGEWMHLTFVVSTSEVSVYVNGELLGAYYCPYDVNNAEWMFLNAWEEWTYFAYVEKTGLHTGRLGSGYLSLGDQSGVDMVGEMDNVAIYSKAMNAEAVAALFAAENAELALVK